MNLRSEREPVFKALYGLGCVTSSAIVRTGKLVGGKVGILPIDQFRHTLRLRDSDNNDKSKAFVAKDFFRLKRTDNESV